MNTGEAQIIGRNLQFFGYFVTKTKKTQPKCNKSFDFVRYPIDNSVYSLLDPYRPTRYSINFVR